MSEEEKIKTLFRPGTESFECYDILKYLLSTNTDFRKKILEGIDNGLVRGFSEKLWAELNEQNIVLDMPGVKSFDDYFRYGYNLGACKIFSQLVCFSLSDGLICGGELPLLVGTKNCPDGGHTWIEYRGEIIDTSLMLCMNIEFREKLEYKKENEYDPNKSRSWRGFRDVAMMKKEHKAL